jgi:hypothetical protein
VGPGSLVCPRTRSPWGTQGVSWRSCGAARSSRGAGGANLALGVRPLRGSQVQVAPLSSDQRSPERSAWRERDAARGASRKLLVLNVAGRGRGSPVSGRRCGVGVGARLSGCPVSAGEVWKGFP